MPGYNLQEACLFLDGYEIMFYISMTFLLSLTRRRCRLHIKTLAWNVASPRMLAWQRNLMKVGLWNSSVAKVKIKGNQEFWWLWALQTPCRLFWMELGLGNFKLWMFSNIWMFLSPLILNGEKKIKQYPGNSSPCYEGTRNDSYWFIRIIGLKICRLNKKKLWKFNWAF